MQAFEIIEHTADVGFKAWGSSAAELFANAARALIAIAAESTGVALAGHTEVTVNGHDYESLMVNWLDEILYLFDTGRFAPWDFTIHDITPVYLKARLTGEPRDPVRHPWKVIVKAITYHQIEVVERNDGWHATVFVDI